MSISSYALGKLSKFATKKFTKKLSAAQLAAARRNIKKAIAASARKRAAAVGKVAKNPLKSYVASVTRRTIKRRANAANKVARVTAKLKASNQQLSKVLTEQSRQLSVVKGQKAQKMAIASAEKARLEAITTKIQKKGTDGLFGAMRKRELNRVNKMLATVNTQLDNDRAVITRLARDVAVTDGRIAQQQGAINQLTNKYIKLTKAPTLANKAGTVVKDATLVGGLTAGGVVGYNKMQERKNKKS